MKVFECIGETHNLMHDFVIQPNRAALWAAAFGVDSLDDMFDMTPAAEAIPIVDAAIRRFNEDPNSLRPLVAADDPVGLRGNRAVLIELRKFLFENGGTVSGAVEQA
ncbi:hypothetical protein [Nocardia gipuzkoensis]